MTGNGNDIEDLPGVGPTTADKLKEAGYISVESIATSSPAELAEVAEISEAVAKKLVKAAKDRAVVSSFRTGADIMEQRKNVRKLKTFVPELDALLDTENTFRPERIEQMVNGLGTDVPPLQEFLDHIHVARAHTSDHQMLMVENAKELANELRDGEKPVRLFIVDSLTAHFRAEYAGRGTLAARQQKLNRHMHDLFRLLDEHNAVGLVTNQVLSNPAVFFGDPTKPIGGNIVGHTATFRIYLRKSKGGKRIAKLVDSPNLPEGEAVFMVEQTGLKPV
jgi:DNA repair protein RadA